MNFKTAAQLEIEINKLTDELTALRESEGLDYLAGDMALQTVMKNLTAAYKSKDYLRMKTEANYIAEIQTHRAPESPDAERDWKELSSPAFGVMFPPNWSMPKDIVMPRGKFTVFGAAQKTGKTRAMLSHCLYLADVGHRVSIMSGEMPTSQIWLNMWMQSQFLEFRNSFGEIEARKMMASKDLKYTPTQDSYHSFRKKYAEKIFVIYTPGWTARRIVYGHKLSENLFGKPATVWATDYAQIIAKEPTIRDMRESQIYNSQLFTVATGLANVAHILVSQLNNDGMTAESAQYERDAGMVINFRRDEDKDTGEKSPKIKIHVKHSRSTASGIFERWLDVKSGAIVNDSTYQPPDARGNLYEN
jgi:hypothetical protein